MPVHALDLLNYAVDYNNDGKRDIWKSEADVFAWIANYLAAEGWQSEGTWGREVNFTEKIDTADTGIDHPQQLEDWQALGVREIDGGPLPKRSLQAWLIQPDGSEGRSFLVYDNYRALTHWNRSSYFALTVGLFADRIKEF